ncbi:DUF7709 family protein [Acinetobacter ursingii]|uniref:DUF7709 family protein n=2 Tax=Acinetobacter ursingii TaxID=108980 RepID=UPI003AB2D361
MIEKIISSLSLYKKAGEKQELILVIPTLFKVSLFDLFPVEEWINGENQGRKIFGKQAKPYQNKQHRLTR